ncbi:hypothetical protein ACU8KH_01075 [Lachancea thermotolerans]
MSGLLLSLTWNKVNKPDWASELSINLTSQSWDLIDARIYR